MIGIYTRPLRVYIALGALALWGILSGLQLPISLFPTSSQTTVAARIPVGSLSEKQFYEAYGRDLESKLQSLKIDSIGVKSLEADYSNLTARYKVTFDWGADSEKAMNDVRNLITTRFAGSPQAITRSIEVYSYRGNSGFLAVSFYSPLRSLDELYKTLEPMTTPMSSKITDADGVGLFNPNRKEVTITLTPEKLAQYEITSSEIQNAIQGAVVGLNGGTLRLGEKDYQIDLPKSVDNLELLGQVRISARNKAPIFLKDVAKITESISKESRQKFKTSGIESLILFANPKEGGNIKNMADQVMQELKVLEHKWPADVQYKVLVNPSEFIDNSVHSVVHEVFLAAFLAVVVLFLFIGSFKNVITAAIEIPLSLLLAFILMRLAGMNLNLISLGGLALSAGMNVDASVVVLENILRHFEIEKRTMTYAEKAKVILEAVNEVRMPIIASTLASLVVFLPLIFTQGLTHSLLGDLAKAVIFSHGLSAIVALVLVPTIRLQLISRGHLLESHSPIEGTLKRIERFYGRTLEYFLGSRKMQLVAFGSVLLLLPLLIFTVIPNLKKEVIGKPESDWMIMGVNSPTFATMKQLESELEDLETDLNKNFGSDIQYTFTQIQGIQNGIIMIRLKDKSRIVELVTKAEEIFKNTPTKSYWVDQWNPSELEIPDPPHFRLEITGGDPTKRLQVAQDLQTLLLERGVFDKVSVTPTAEKESQISVQQYFNSGSESEVMSKQDLSHYLRVATSGVYVERLFQNQQELPIYLRLANDSVTSLEQMKALPIGFEGKLVPLGALARLNLIDRAPRIYQENQQPIIVITGRVNKANLHETATKQAQAHKLVEEFKSTLATEKGNMPLIAEVQADKDLQESLLQLKWAIAISIALVFLVMVLQLGEVVPSLLVLVAIPLGFIGVIISLFVFRSSLSLNSGLGTILLNGIAVANSIILVDFIRKLHAAGKNAKAATLEASVARLRPILMTSLTTVLGMMPIALGLGEGGKILQPLGIAVCGGLWVSTLLTLYIVPALQYLYLSRNEKAS
ncbi:MAG: efflux RND transporter permease subunit [Bdellovibrionaceae bacterium]|nr:efflux RND transporter permease subunit [Pseudobdellovibrionaceae bacterium]